MGDLGSGALGFRVPGFMGFGTQLKLFSSLGVRGFELGARGFGVSGLQRACWDFIGLFKRFHSFWLVTVCYRACCYSSL